MKTFKNADFKKTNAVTSNVIACTTEGNPPAGNWVECDATVLEGLEQLWKAGDVRFFGRM